MLQALSGKQNKGGLIVTRQSKDETPGCSYHHVLTRQEAACQPIIKKRALSKTTCASWSLSMTLTLTYMLSEE